MSRRRKSPWTPVKAYFTVHPDGNHFCILKDLHAGKTSYYVFVWRVGKTAKIIGRELPLAFAKEVVKHYPQKAWLREKA